MKKILIIAFLSLFLVGYISAANTLTAQMGNGNGSQNSEENTFCCRGFYESTGEDYYFRYQNEDCGYPEGTDCAGSCPTKVEESECESWEIKNQERQKIRNQIRTQNGSLGNCPEEAPENCTCFGTTAICQNAEGKRLNIQVGNSGKIRIQTGTTNASTDIPLRLSNGKYYGELKGNITREIKIMPDVAAERAIERLRLKNCNESNGCTIELKEVGQGNEVRAAYEVQAQKQARFLGLFKTRMQVQAQIDAETGETIQTKKPWWAFLASESDEEENVVGDSCSTVTPGENDACCVNKGFSFYNNETGECE